jgi:hypothetical protein
MHPSSMMMIHRARYFESTNSLDENAHPPIFLRYAVCALGASLSETHSIKHNSLYLSSRTYLQEAELRDQKMDKVDIAYAETWILISMYEMIHAHFHRSWMSISRAVRMIQFLQIFLYRWMHSVSTRLLPRYHRTYSLIPSAANILEWVIC